MIHLSEGETRVVDVLRQNPGSTPTTLIQKSGVSRTTVRNALIKAQAQGHLIVNMEWPRRYSWVDIQPAEEAAPGYAVAPDVVKTGEIGKAWKAGRPRIVKVIEGLDFPRMTKQQIEEGLSSVIAALTGIYIAVARIEDGPEWRKEAGIS